MRFAIQIRFRTSTCDSTKKAIQTKRPDVVINQIGRVKKRSPAPHGTSDEEEEILKDGPVLYLDDVFASIS